MPETLLTRVMARRQSEAPCAACKKVAPSAKLCRVVIETKTLLLCRDHAAVVAASMPRTFQDLRALFPEQDPGGDLVRRSAIERRVPDDRRAFPPRPEGRRQRPGRRGSDQAA